MSENKTEGFCFAMGGHPIESEASKPSPINPMSFMSEEQASVKDKEFEAFKKALRFGTPTLCDKLMAIYRNDGLDGLKKVEQLITNADYIMHVINSNDQWFIDFFPSYSTKEDVIKAIVSGEIDFDSIPEDVWKDPE